MGWLKENIQGPGAVAAVAVALSVLLLAWLKKRSASRRDDGSKKHEFPRGPRGWPIIGHLALLKSAPHRVLANLSWKEGYGAIIGLRLGSVPAVVVSSAALAKEVLHTNDKIFANRPHYQFVDDLYYGYNTAVVFSSYNPRWAWMRKIYTLELFTQKQLQQLQHVRQEEVRHLLDRLSEGSRGGMQAVDVGKLLADTTANTTARLLQSKSLAEVASDLPHLVHCLEAEAFPTLGDFIPSLKFLDAFSRRRLHRIHNRIDQVINSILHERRQLMARCPPHDLPHDFLQVLLSKEATTPDEDHLTTQEIKGIILDIFAGGVHTSSVTLEWAIAELLRNPECMSKLQEEVDAVMGSRQEIVNDEDVGRMPYLVNAVKEVLRLHQVVPLLFPRIASRECKVDKYMLPKGTHALVNVWAIARDPLYWERAEEFWPQRFEGKDLDLRGQHYELLPFGGGRRVCPGIRLGLSIVHVTLANLVRTFDWELPLAQMPSSIDMSEKGGIGNSKALPLLVIPKARRCQGPSPCN